VLKISSAGSPDLSPIISAQFTLEMCVAAQNHKKKLTKTPYFGGSRSFKVLDVDSPKKLVRSACCDKQHLLSMPICNHFHAKQANSGKITSS